MSDKYRSKLRTPKKELKAESFLWQNSPSQLDFGGFPSYTGFLNTPSPAKRKHNVVSESQFSVSPHKSGYFLRTPSPHKAGRGSPHKAGFASPPHTNSNYLKTEISGTPSPHKAGSVSDLFGNRSLLENLPMPEWDENFLDDFQEDLLFGLGNEDLEGLVKSPLKSPMRGQTFLNNSPLRRNSPRMSPFKSPLLTSSPKSYDDNPGNVMKTPSLSRGRPLTRQKKLFLQSPERQQMPSISESDNWSAPFPIPFSTLDEDSSSMFSDGGHETTTSIQSISSYLKQFDEEDNEEEYPIMPPAGWTQSDRPTNPKMKSHGKGKGKAVKSKHNRFLSSPSSSSGAKVQQKHNNTVSNVGAPGVKKMKFEPQFTLLRPHTELHNNQICLRMTPRTPPNKIKISRDFSQIQTLPSKEQLRIVRNRFQETLNKAVEQVIEREKEKKVNKEKVKVNDPTLRNALQRPVAVPADSLNSSSINNGLHHHTGKKPPAKKRKR